MKHYSRPAGEWLLLALLGIATLCVLELCRKAVFGELRQSPESRVQSPEPDQRINESTNQRTLRIVVLGQSELLPPISEGNTLIFSPLFIASLNPETKLADWVRYRTTPAYLDSPNVLKRNWRTNIPEQALEDPDYAGGPYDRGHLVPLACFDGSRDAWQVNCMEVVAPQTPALNRGPWLKLEERIRTLTRAHGEAVVTCGTLYAEDMPPLPAADESHTVPSHYWLTITAGGKSEHYLLPQTVDRGADPKDFAVEEEVIKGR